MQSPELLGNIGKDARVAKVSENRVAINFDICSTRTFMTSEGKQSRSTWFPCTIWAPEDKVSTYFTKGRPVALGGHFENNTRTIQEEGKETPTKIQGLYFNVTDFQFFDKQDQEG